MSTCGRNLCSHLMKMFNLKQKKISFSSHKQHTKWSTNEECKETFKNLFEKEEEYTICEIYIND